MVSHVRNIDRSDSIACARLERFRSKWQMQKGLYFFSQAFIGSTGSLCFKRMYCIYIYIRFFGINPRREIGLCVYIHASATRDLTIVFLSHITLSYLSIFSSLPAVESRERNLVRTTNQQIYLRTCSANVSLLYTRFLFFLYYIQKLTAT